MSSSSQSLSQLVEEKRSSSPKSSSSSLPASKRFELYFATVLNVTTLCMAVAAMVSAGVAFADTVQPSQISRFGEVNFAVVKAILVFFPFVYVPWLFFIFNNANSIMTYHEFIEVGIIIDFKQSASPAFVLNHNLSFLFLVSFVFYISFAGSLFLHFSSPLNVVTLFFKQFVFECILFYLSLLTVDSDLLSLRDFIDKFGNSNEEAEEFLTKESLQTAAHKLANDFQVVSADVAFSSSTEISRKKYFGASNSRDDNDDNTVAKNPNFGRIELFLYGQYAFMVLGLIGVGYYQYQADRRNEIRDRWTSSVNPCVHVCVDQQRQQQQKSEENSFFYERLDNISSSSSSFSSVSIGNVVSCQKCLCSCLSALQMMNFDNDQQQEEGCFDYLNVGTCSSTSSTRDLVCRGVGEYCI